MSSSWNSALPVVALNRVVALSKVDGPAAALSALLQLTTDPTLRNYYLLPAVEGFLRLELGDRQNAAACFRRMIELPCSEPERRLLQ